MLAEHCEKRMTTQNHERILAESLVNLLTKCRQKNVENVASRIFI